MDVIVFGAFVKKVVDFFRNLRNWRTERSAILTQTLAFVGGIVVVVLASHAKVTADLVLPGMSTALGHLDGSSQVLYGLMVGAAGSLLADGVSAIDNTDSAATPPLVAPPQGV